MDRLHREARFTLVKNPNNRVTTDSTLLGGLNHYEEASKEIEAYHQAGSTSSLKGAVNTKNMATEFLYDLSPPPFNANTDDFHKWERKFNLWLAITDIPKVKRAAFLLLNLDEDTQDTVLDLVSESEINHDNGVETVVKILIYSKKMRI